MDKSAMERLLLLADFSVTLNGVFNDAADFSHAVFKTVPSTSVNRTVTLTVSGQTLANECVFSAYDLTRAADGSLVWTAPGAGGRHRAHLVLTCRPGSSAPHTARPAPTRKRAASSKDGTPPPW